jgi:hypothetical protein
MRPAKTRLLSILLLAQLILALASPLFRAASAVQSTNLDIEIPPEYGEIAPGGNLLFTIRVFNLATKGRIDVVLENSIINGQGRVVLTKSETVAVETQASFVRNIAIPSDMPLGNYKLQTRLIYPDSTSTVSERYFDITEKNDMLFIYILAGSIILLLALIAFLSSKIGKVIDRLKIRIKIHKAVKKMFSGR